MALFTRVLASSAVLLSSVVASAAAEDVLVSQRLQKRYIDADGNYNICMRSNSSVSGFVSGFSAYAGVGVTSC